MTVASRFRNSCVASLSTAIALSALPQFALAQGCDVRSVGVAGISLGDFNPLAKRALTRDLSFALSGPVASRAWVRVQTLQSTNASDHLAIEYLGLTNSGLARIDVGSNQAISSDVASLNTSWLPVFFDAQGQGTARVMAHIPDTAYAMAGSRTEIVNLAVACEQDSIIQVDTFPVTVASLNLRVVSAIRVSDPTNSVLRFGTIPENNPEGYSPVSARAAMSIASTGGFDVKLTSADWSMRGVTENGANGRDSIQFRATLMTSNGTELEATEKSINCVASPDAQTSQTLELRAQLPVNAGLGKLAGLYRGHLTVEVSPVELAATGQSQGCFSS